MIATLRRREKTLQIALLALLGVLAVWGFPHTASEDIPHWLHWMRFDREHGIIDGYRQWPLDYPPAVRLVLAIPAAISAATGVDPGLALKGAFVAAWLVSGWMTLRITRSRWLSLALLASLWLNHVGIGYLDAFVIPLILAGFTLLERRRWLPGFLVFMAASLVKWQPGIMGPFVAAHIVNSLARGGGSRWALRAAGIIALPGIACLVLLLSLFGESLLGAFRQATTNFFISGNALNLNWVYTVALHLIDPARFGALGRGETLIITRDPALVLAPKILFWCAYLWILVRFVARRRGFVDLLGFAALGSFTYFELNTGVHENHLVMILPVLCLLCARAPRWGALFAATAIFVNLNMLLFYGLDGREMQLPKTVPGAAATAILSLAGTGIYLALVLRLRSAVRPAPLPASGSRGGRPGREASPALRRGRRGSDEPPPSTRRGGTPGR